jgi:hypothetical protein
LKKSAIELATSRNRCSLPSATALGGTRVEFTKERIQKSEFKARVGQHLNAKYVQGQLWEKAPDRLCVVIPSIDQRGEWLCTRLKGLFERATRPFVLLASAPDTAWMPDYWRGHVFVCRKKGAALGSRHKDARQTSAVAARDSDEHASNG